MDRSLTNQTPDLSHADSSLQDRIIAGHNAILGQVEYFPKEDSTYSTILPSLSWIFDNSVYGFTGPIDGFRKNTTITVSPGYGSNKLKFQEVPISMRYPKKGSYSKITPVIDWALMIGAWLYAIIDQKKID